MGRRSRLSGERPHLGVDAPLRTALMVFGGEHGVGSTRRLAASRQLMGTARPLKVASVHVEVAVCEAVVQ